MRKMVFGPSDTSGFGVIIWSPADQSEIGCWLK